MTVPLWRKLVVLAVFAGLGIELSFLLGNDDSGLWITLALLFVFSIYAPDYTITWPWTRNPHWLFSRVEGAYLGGLIIGAALVWHFTHLVPAVIAWVVVASAAGAVIAGRLDNRDARLWSLTAEQRKRWVAEQFGRRRTEGHRR
jgi:hypothetical protein